MPAAEHIQRSLSEQTLDVNGEQIDQMPTEDALDLCHALADKSEEEQPEAAQLRRDRWAVIAAVFAPAKNKPAQEKQSGAARASKKRAS